MHRSKLPICQFSTGHRSYELRVFQKQCRSLAKRYDVTLILPHTHEEKKDGVYIKPYRAPDSRWKRFLFGPFRIYFQLPPASIYHFHDPELVITGCLLKLFRRCAVIYDVHEDVVETVLTRDYIPSILRPVVQFAVLCLNGLCSILFDQIICVTDKIATRFKRARHCDVIYNYPILDDRFADPEVSREHSVAFFGNASEHRGIRPLCKAFEILNEQMGISCRLRLIGRIWPEALEKEMLDTHGKYLDYYGWIDIEQAYREVQRSSIGVMTYLPGPNHDDCLPNKFFEYMGFGMAVVSSRFPLLREIVEVYRTGFCVDPSNACEIADRLSTLLRDPSMASEMGERGRSVIQSKFNWNIMEQRLLDIYERLHREKGIA